jgi:hypothetical protein
VSTTVKIVGDAMTVVPMEPHPLYRVAAALERIADALERQPLPVVPTVRAPYSKPLGCGVCGAGADGKPLGYVCSRTDCPSSVQYTTTTTLGG